MPREAGEAAFEEGIPDIPHTRLPDDFRRPSEGPTGPGYPHELLFTPVRAVSVGQHGVEGTEALIRVDSAPDIEAPGGGLRRGGEEGVTSNGEQQTRKERVRGRRPVSARLLERWMGEEGGALAGAEGNRVEGGFEAGMVV